VIYFCFLSLSCFWSDYLGYAIQRYSRVLGFFIFLYLVENRFGLKGINSSIQSYIKICAVLSIVFIFIIPQYGMMDYEGSLVPKGLFGHKNVLSVFSALAIIFLWFEKNKNFYFWLFLCSFLLFISSGRTAQVALVAAFLFGIFYSNFISMRGVGKILIGAIFVSFILLILSGLLFIQNPIGEMLGLLGKDSSFTGRTDIWPVLLKMAMQKPILGYGFNSFFVGVNSEWLIKYLDWQAYHAHNGILEVFLETGIVGVLLTLSFVFVVFKKNYKNIYGISTLLLIMIYNCFGAEILQSTFAFFMLIYLDFNNKVEKV
jgi:exopolysaccharide production protein ExoQ